MYSCGWPLRGRVARSVPLARAYEAYDSESLVKNLISISVRVSIPQ